MRFRVADKQPVFSVTLGDGTKIIAHPGAIIEAPEDSAYIKRLVAKKFLKPLPVEEVAK